MLRCRIALVALVAPAGLGVGSGCAGHPDDTGSAAVTITLSRSGGSMGPTFDHVPQAGDAVSVSNAAGRAWSAATDGDGVARFELPVGTYTVDHSSCSAVSGPFRVRAGVTTPVEVDCIAP